MNSLMNKYKNMFKSHNIYEVVNNGATYSTLYGDNEWNRLPSGCIVKYTLPVEFRSLYKDRYTPCKGKHCFILHDYGNNSRSEHVYLVKSINEDLVFVIGERGLKKI